MGREELNETAKMLQVEGQPSRSSIIQYIYIENIHNNTSDNVNQLFNLIENEESPYVISKKGKVVLDSLKKQNQDLGQYHDFIAKTLSVRILQKCKSFYKNMKLSKLLKMLWSYDSL